MLHTSLAERLHVCARLTLYLIIALLLLACTAAPTAQVAPTAPTQTPALTQTPQRVFTATAPTPVPTLMPQRVVSTLTITPLASLGGDVTAVAISGTWLFSSDTSRQLIVYDRRDPARLRPLAHIAVPEPASSIQYADGMLYLLTDNARQLVDVRVPEHPQARGRFELPPPEQIDDPDRLVHASVQGNRLLISRIVQMGEYPKYVFRIVIVDITDPDNPKQERELTLPGVQGRDAYIVGDLVYVAEPFPAFLPGAAVKPEDVEGLHIFDIQNQDAALPLGKLRLGTSYGVWVFGNYAYVGHAVFRFQSGYTYTENEQLSIIDIRDPENPRRLGIIDTFDRVADVQVEGDTIYITSNLRSGDTDGDVSWLQIVDVRDRDHPIVRRKLDLKGRLAGMAVADQHIYIAARAGGLQIIDATQPERAALLASYGMPGQAYDVRVDGDVAYVRTWAAVESSSLPANYALTLVDIRDPANPVISARYALSSDFDVVNGIAYIPGPSRGLQIIDARDPALPTLLTTFVPGSTASAVRVVSDTAYLVGEKDGLSIIDVHDPARPVLQGRYQPSAPLHTVEVSGPVAYVSGIEAGVHAVDVRDPARPYRLSQYTFPSNEWRARVIGNTAYIYHRSGGLTQPGLQIVDLRDPVRPQLRAEFDIKVTKLRVVDSIVYVVGEKNSQDGLFLIDLRFPERPRLIGSYYPDVFGSIDEVGVVDRHAMLFLADDKVHIIDVHDPAKPRLQTRLSFPLPYSLFGYGTVFKDDLAYVAAGERGLQIWQLSR